MYLISDSTGILTPSVKSLNINGVDDFNFGRGETSGYNMG